MISRETEPLAASPSKPTPEALPWPDDRASPLLRLKAALGDWLCAVLSNVPGLLIAGLGWVTDQRSFITVGIIVSAIGVSGLFFYQMVVLARDGQTLAKRWFGLRIVKNDRSPAGFFAAVFLRVLVPLALCAILPLLPVPGYLGAMPIGVYGQFQVFGLLGFADALLIFGPSRRCLHDYLAGTRVLVVAPPDPRRTRQILAMGIVMGAALAVRIAFGLIALIPHDCAPGTADCNRIAADGCEADLASSQSCGACGKVCASRNGVASCEGGECVLRCGRGRGDCNGSASDGCEVDLATNGRSCGACGHGCLGARCEEGVCAPVLFRWSGVAAFSVHGSVLYAALETGEVVGLPLDGGAATSVSSQENAPHALATGEQAVYWVRGKGAKAEIRRWPIGGGPVESIASGDAHTIVEAANSVYFTGGDRIFRIAQPGDHAEPIGPARMHASALAVNGRGVFWLDRARGALSRMALSGAQVTELATGLEALGAIAVDESYVYGSAGDQVFRIPVIGGRPETMGPPLPKPVSIALDEAHLFVATGSGVVALRKADGVVMPLWSSSPTKVAVDTSAVYWLGAAGGISRLAR